MAEGRSRELWDHTSYLLAMLANGLCRGKGKPAFQPRQFHPFEIGKKPIVEADQKEGFRMLKVFVDGRKCGSNQGRARVR